MTVVQVAVRLGGPLPQPLWNGPRFARRLTPSTDCWPEGGRGRGRATQVTCPPSSGGSCTSTTTTAPTHQRRGSANVETTAKTIKRPRHNQHNPQYANDWAPLTHKRHIPPHSAQPRHTNYWAPRTRKRHQREHRPQRPTERSDPTQHAKGRPGDCPGPRKGTTTRRNVTRGGGYFAS